MSRFSANESISLEKRIDFQSNITKTNADNINYVYEIEKCAKFIQENTYNKVCLQFPDYLLPDSSEIVHRLETIIGRKVYILGDTAYESCCIDFTAAKHISADCIIHFGTVCFSKAENIIPYLNIYEKFDFDSEEFCKVVQNTFEHDNLLFLIDTPYIHKIDEIQRNLPVHQINSVENIELTSSKVVYVGQNDRKLMNIYLNYNPQELYYYDPKNGEAIINYEQDTKILKRRYFLIEKIKDSATIGLVISTLAVQNYLKIIDRLITLIKLHEKKYYIISVGKPNVAKLANFPEIDVFVIVGCAMNEIYENRDFYKPIVTSNDLESALNKSLDSVKLSYDFNEVLMNDIDKVSINTIDKSDVSLLTGQIRFREQQNDVSDIKETDNQIAVRPDGKLVISDNYGAGFLANRTWQGLQQDLGKTGAQLATEGRKGIAQSYDNENK